MPSSFFVWKCIYVSTTHLLSCVNILWQYQWPTLVSSYTNIKYHNYKTNAAFLGFLPPEQIKQEKKIIFSSFNLGNYRCLDVLTNAVAPSVRAQLLDAIRHVASSLLTCSVVHSWTMSFRAVIWRVWTCAAAAGQSLLDMASEPSRWGCSLVVRSKACGPHQPVLDSLIDWRGRSRLEPGGKLNTHKYSQLDF